MKSIVKFMAVAVVSVFAFTASAEEKEQTFSGKGECAKCALDKAESCQMAITVKEDGKDKTYLLENNAVTKAYHKNICQSEKKVKVTGTFKEKDGEKVIVAKKVETQS